MLQPHSILWHYLWVAPNLLLVILAVLLWQRGIHRRFPGFLAFAIISAAAEFTVYAADLLPSVSNDAFWRIFCIALLIETLVKFALIGELFAQISGAYPSIAAMGKNLIRIAGALLVLVSAVAAAFAPIDNPDTWLIPRSHILEQTVYLISTGLLLFIFLFAAYFHLAWKSKTFGIALGLGISACVHLATWAVIANGGLIDRRYLLDMLNMATYHVCVLLWIYYLLLRREDTDATQTVLRLPEHNLEIWNRELERLLHR